MSVITDFEDKEIILEDEPVAKVCTKCKEPKPIEQFKKAKRHNMKSVVFYRRGICRECDKKRARESAKRRANGEPSRLRDSTYPDLLINDDNRLIAEQIKTAWR